jgi:tripartite-type tricarboxylate transporter receptor subunit TctC
MGQAFAMGGGHQMKAHCIFVAGIMAVCSSADAALAQDWPTRPVTLVVPFGAGGSSDVIGRVVAEGLRVQLGQPVIVENISGAGGMIGASRVAKAAPDGYQFVIGNVGTHAQNQWVYKTPLYDAARAFAPVGLVADQSLVLVARKDFPAEDLRNFITYAKANQDKLRYGSSGTGGSNHLACMLFNAAVSLDVAHVPYRSGGQAMQDLIAGRIDYQCPSGPVALPQIEGKTVKAIALLRKQRSPGMPGVPSAQEQGLTDLDIPSWYALFLPMGTPEMIVQKLHKATVAALEMPSVQKGLIDVGSDLIPPEHRSPDYLGKYVAAEIEKWGKIIKLSSVQIN